MSLPDNPFYEIPALLLLAAALGGAALRLRQPLIVAFIAVGILAGPSVLDWVRHRDQIDLLARLGIALLLFVVGLKLDVRLVRSVGPVSMATGLGQVAFTALVGFLLCLALGFGGVSSVYIAVALTFSSTIIIVKLLTDKREIDSLHGRIAVGFLIVQDIVVVLAMVVLVAWDAGSGEGRAAQAVAATLARGAGLLGAFLLAMRFLLPRLAVALSRSGELLVLFAVAWAVLGAAASELLGFGTELGAFLAGASLASTRPREAIASRLTSLRDFLLLFFFIDLGASLDLGLVGVDLGPALVLSLFVLVGNPLIVMVIMGALGYRSRTGFLAGLTVAQISEFSLILAALGVRLGHIDAATLGLVTLVGLITIGASTYLILYSHPLYERMAPWLGVFERRGLHREEQSDRVATAPVILFGLGRYGERIAHELDRHGVSVLGVDFDPRALRAWQRRGQPARYGDAEDPDLPGSLPLADARWVVSTLPLREANLALLHALREHGYAGGIALSARTPGEAAELEARGADLVLYPFADAARAAAELLVDHEARPLRASRDSGSRPA
jgi:Kef-type K+ transport system membrane component KefB